MILEPTGADAGEGFELKPVEGLVETYGPVEVKCVASEGDRAMVGNVIIEYMECPFAGPAGMVGGLRESAIGDGFSPLEYFVDGDG